MKYKVNIFDFQIQKNKKDRITTKLDKGFIDTIIKSLKSSKCKNFESELNEKKIPIQKETLEIRNELFSKFTENNKFKLKNNLNNDQISCMKKYIKEKPFILSNSDKNVGWVMLDKTLYLKLAYDHLNKNENVYNKLEYNPLKEVEEKIISSLKYLNDNGHISNRLYKKLIPIDSNLGKFKILPKLHKSKFDVRPIINSRNHPTEKLSQFIDLFLQPFVKTSESYLKDSQHLLQLCDKKQIDKKWFKYSCDFESLYTNIDTKLAILKISEYFSDKISNFDFNIVAFNEILKLVLFNNIFSFDNKYFIQKNGLAMGTKCGPTIANTYVYILEINWLKMYKPVLYRRFIDDIFIISKYDLINSNFLNIFDNLKLNIVEGKQVQFLDLVISDDVQFDKLKFNLYTKPTNTFQYLAASSNHPEHIFNNIPKSIFIRYRRNNSSYIDYLSSCRTLISQLESRGYNKEDLIRFCLIIGQTDREKLLPYKDKSLITKYNEKCFKFIINYDLNYLNLKYEFLNICNNLSTKFDWLNNYNFHYLNSINKNLNNIFIYNNYSIVKSYTKTKKCNDKCFCKFNYDKNQIKINSFILPMFTNSNCQLSRCIYILICVKCYIYYIGQTGRSFSDRFYQHAYNIKKFKAIVNEKSEVAQHFNLKTHNYINDLKFLIFKDNLELSERLSIENDLINLFLKLRLNILNKII